MTDKLQFPLTVRSDGEEFVINREDERNSPGQFYPDFDGDRGRSKRRRRCGQCGPCQVKENCNKCNFCLRRDVLKQTCIYRKCVYLRSKPKPYPHLPGGTDTNPVLSPPNHSSSNSSNVGNISERPNSCGAVHSEENNQTTSNIFNPFTPVTTSSTHSFLSGESLFKPPIPQPSLRVVSSPERILPPPPPQIPPYNTQSMQTIQSSHNPVPITSCLNDRVLPDTISLPNPIPLHESSCSSFTSPMSHSHIPNESIKYDSYFNRYSRPLPSNDTRTNLPSPCMYHPGFPPPFHGTTGPIDRSPYHGYVKSPSSFPPYIPSSSNMLRHLPSLPHRYPMHPPPPGRFVDSFSEPSQFPTGYNNYGFQPTDIQMPIHHNVSHHHHHPLSNINRYQAPHYEQSNMCPKNVYGPPAFPSLALGALRVQERPHGIPNIRCNLPYPISRPFPWEKHFFHPIQRPNSVTSDDTSKLSTTSSGFECDVISIDDIEMNAYIRSDGCNSIEIEIEDLSSPNSKKAEVLKPESDMNCNYKSKVPSPRKITLCGKVTLKQDLGDEGVIQLEIPGDKVTIEETELVPSLAKYSCNLTDLLKFIESEPRNRLETQQDVICQ